MINFCLGKERRVGGERPGASSASKKAALRYRGEKKRKRPKHPRYFIEKGRKTSHRYASNFRKEKKGKLGGVHLVGEGEEEVMTVWFRKTKLCLRGEERKVNAAPAHASGGGGEKRIRWRNIRGGCSLEGETRGVQRNASRSA